MGLLPPLLCRLMSQLGAPQKSRARSLLGGTRFKATPSDCPAHQAGPDHLPPRLEADNSLSAGSHCLLPFPSLSRLEPE